MNKPIKVRMSYYLYDYQRFPWDSLGLTKPSAGGLHSYLCELMVPYAPPALKGYLMQRPTLFELRKKIEGDETGFIEKIVDFCDRKISSHKTSFIVDQPHLAADVLEFLSRQKAFTDWAELELNKQIRSGKIFLPPGAIDTFIDEKPQKQKNYYDLD